MLTNLRLTDLRVTTAQQRTAGQNLPSDLYISKPNVIKNKTPNSTVYEYS
jgi:hypothetical protein